MTPITSQFHNINDLFAQLGLEHSDAAIDAFFQQHAPLSETIEVWDAPWWNASQSQLLHEIFKDDAEWVMVADEFNSRLRKKF